jgi:hypothetical protein
MAEAAAAAPPAAKVATPQQLQAFADRLGVATRIERGADGAPVLDADGGEAAAAVFPGVEVAIGDDALSLGQGTLHVTTRCGLGRARLCHAAAAGREAASCKRQKQRCALMVRGRPARAARPPARAAPPPPLPGASSGCPLPAGPRASRCASPRS